MIICNANPPENYTIHTYALLRGITLPPDQVPGMPLEQKAYELSEFWEVPVGRVRTLIGEEVNTYHIDILQEVYG